MSKKFVPRERKHKKLARQNATHPRENGSAQANATELLPTSKAEREERRRKLQDEIKSQQPQDKIGSKKRKRLDKYIHTKLKKEENQDLLKKLSQQQQLDPGLLQSSRKLGRGHESKRERFERAIKERDAGIGDGDILFEERQVGHDGSEENDSEDDPHANTSVQATQLATQALDGSNLFGIGLKRPLETDDAGQPLIKRRKRRKQTKEVKEAVSEPEIDPQQSETGGSDESEWNGFDSDENVENGESEDGEDSGESEGDDGEEESDDEGSDDRPARVSAFKAWANLQRNEAVGFTSSAIPANNEAAKAAFKPRMPSPDPVAAEITASNSANGLAYRPQAAVVIPRSEEIQAARLELPVVQEEQKIMEAIHNNPVTIVCGATGSGKTTQIPQMLLENGYGTEGMIGVTQPRRVAAVSVASRVTQELGPDFGKQVAHQVRYDSNVGRGTKIKFMTDGILLREISHDFALTKYSAIVIDEAHERSVNTDILIGMLSRIVQRHELSKGQPVKYKPLKLIIMSATLRVADFLMNARLFKGGAKPPIVEAEGRQYPVTEHFARRTQRDYVNEMVRKVSTGHRKLPPGGILVFLTGQDEIQAVAKKLKEEFASSNTGFTNSRRPTVSQKPSSDYLEKEEDRDDDSDAEIHGLDDDYDTEDEEFDGVEADPALPRRAMKANILPLYAALPADQQMRVFKPAPEGSRSIVLATNVAETSLTIPGVRYVFDCGRSKEKCYDEKTGVQEFKIDWISKASASQRMGRAGRTGPGHCYRLYSSAIYEQYFEEHTTPEILRTPIEGTVLQLKTMQVPSVVDFPFPTPPRNDQLVQAERLLKNIGAINTRDGKVTDVGNELIHYPVNPRFGKMLWLGLRNKVLAFTIALVAGLAVGDLFIPEPQATSNPTDDAEDPEYQRLAMEMRKQDYGRAQARLRAWDDKADIMKTLTAVAAYASEENKRDFCSQYSVRERRMAEVVQQRMQLHKIMESRVKDLGEFTSSLPLPEAEHINLLKQIVASGYIDQVAIRADKLGVPTGRKPIRANEVAYRTLVPSVSESEIDRTASPGEQAAHRSVYVHGSSVLNRLSVHEMPDYVIYSHLSTREGQSRTRMHPLTGIHPRQLAKLAENTPLLEFGKPIGKIEGDGVKRVCWVGISLRDPTSVGAEWPLGAWKVRQVKKKGEWVVEEVIYRGK